jgi:hypothetical protein
MKKTVIAILFMGLILVLTTAVASQEGFKLAFWVGIVVAGASGALAWRFMKKANEDLRGSAFTAGQHNGFQMGNSFYGKPMPLSSIPVGKYFVFHEIYVECYGVYVLVLDREEAMGLGMEKLLLAFRRQENPAPPRRFRAYDGNQGNKIIPWSSDDDEREARELERQEIEGRV